MSQNVYVDTARTAAFSFEISINNDFSKMMDFLLLEAGILCFLFVGISQCKYRKYILFGAILFVFLLDDQKVLETINNTNKVHEGEKIMAEYIFDSNESKPIYFVNGEYKDNVPYFSVMQVLIKNNPVVLIEPEEAFNVEKNAFILCYHESEISLNLQEKYKFIMNNNIFDLYESMEE